MGIVESMDAKIKNLEHQLEIVTLRLARIEKKLDLPPVPRKLTPEDDIDLLNLNSWTHNSLIKQGYTKIGQLLDARENDLLKLKRFARKSLQDVTERLHDEGFEWPRKSDR